MSEENQVSNDAPSQEELESFESEAQSAQPAPAQEAAPKAAEVKAIEKQIEKLEREFKLKVNGREVVEKIDLNDEARIVKALQMEKMATEASQRASAKEKELAGMNQQLDKFFELLKNNPLEVLLNPNLGLNAEELANKILDMKIAEEMKSPEQKALEEAQAKVAKYEQSEKQAKEEAEKLKHEKLQAQYEKEMSDAISSAIDKGKLPPSPYLVTKFAQLMDIAIEKKVDIKAEDLIPIISNAYKRDMKEMSKHMSDEDIEEIMTSDRIKSIRNKRIQAVKAANAKAEKVLKVEDTAQQVAKKEDPKRRGDFFKSLGDW